MNLDLTAVAVPALAANLGATVAAPLAPARRTRAPKRKTRITIYLDDEVLNEFRSQSERCGTGYQTLINAALRKRLNAATPDIGAA